MKPSELLEAKGWCQHNEALDDNRNPVPCDSPKAVSFCIYGALLACGIYTLQSERAIKNIIQASLTYWNDTPGRTKEEVIAALKEAGL